MIKYPQGAYGFQILFRLHGSAVFKSTMPALLSSAIYLTLFHITDLEDEAIIDHPYPIGALIAAFTFLLAFRANFSYNRYWEAYTAVHQMHSKWLDAAMDMAAWHLQSARYDEVRPPCFGENPHLTSLERERERNEATFEEIENQIDEALEKENQESNETMASRFSRWRLRRRGKNNNDDDNNNNNNNDSKNNSQRRTLKNTPKTRSFRKRVNLEKRIQGTKKSINAPAKKRAAKRGHRRIATASTAVTCVTSNSNQRLDGGFVDEKPLFIQEAAHLLSLLSAVAMSTLRNDLENAESPLITFEPGAPFPSVDPDSINADVREGWGEARATLRFATLRYLFGSSRNETNRAIYNAARPFRVVGGISDAEIELLQAARGPLAKVALCTMWVEEFISREQLAGSMGKVAPPIISRLFQFLSDGNLGYNQARKIAYIPFPFAHAQITCLFVLIIVGFIPVLMLTYLNDEVFGFILNLLTVMCFAGLHEVSRELENPFQNAPNDLPANNFHAQFNEALMSMFAGYHPDAYWEIKETPITLEDTHLDSAASLESPGENEGGVSGSNDQEDGSPDQDEAAADQHEATADQDEAAASEDANGSEDANVLDSNKGS